MTLRSLEVQRGFSNSLEDESSKSAKFLEGSSVNQNVVDVDDDSTTEDVLKDIVEEVLKDCRCVSKTIADDHRFKHTILRPERS